MGRYVDLDKPMSESDKDYLTSRGRGYLVRVNERRFGRDGTKEPAPYETAGAPSQSPFYDTQERDRAVYDRGGAPLPGTTLDYDTGRVLDRANGVRLEPSLPKSSAGHYATDLFTSYDEYDSDIDDDIAEEVTKLKVTELKAKLKEVGVEFPSDDRKEDLQDKLAIYLQDQRDGKK